MDSKDFSAGNYYPFAPKGEYTEFYKPKKHNALLYMGGNPAWRIWQFIKLICVGRCYLD